MNPGENHLTGKVALVTGGARRVGREVALTLARAGMDVAITFNASAADAEQTVKDIQALGRRAIAIRVDLSRSDAAEHVRDAFVKQFDSLHALVNNASIFSATPLAKVTAQELEDNMSVNARAPLMLIQKFAPVLAAEADTEKPETLGRIVNFIDIHVMGQPLKGFVAYNASKAALQEITMTAAMELAPRITVNALAPGVVAWAESYTPAQRKQYLQRVPLARAGTPDDAAAAALYLIRDAHYCTGQIIRLDGGRFIT